MLLQVLKRICKSGINRDVGKFEVEKPKITTPPIVNN